MAPKRQRKAKDQKKSKGKREKKDKSSGSGSKDKKEKSSGSKDKKDSASDKLKRANKRCADAEFNNAILARAAGMVFFCGLNRPS